MGFKQIYNNKEYDLANLSETEKSELRLKTMSESVEGRYITTIDPESELYSDKEHKVSYDKYFTSPVFTYVYANGHMEIDWGNIENTIIGFKKGIDDKNLISIFADRGSCPQCDLYSGGTVSPLVSEGASQKPAWYDFIPTDDSFSISLVRSNERIKLTDNKGASQYLDTLALIINIQGPGADGGHGRSKVAFPSRAKGGGGGGAGAFLSLFVNFSTSEFTELYITKDGKAVFIGTGNGMNQSRYNIILSGPDDGEGPFDEEEDNNNTIANGGSGGKITIGAQNTFFRPLLIVDGGDGGAGGLSTSSGSVSDSNGVRGETVEGKYYLLPGRDSNRFTTIKKIGGASGDSSSKQNGIYRQSFAYGGGSGASLASNGLDGGSSKNGGVSEVGIKGKSASSNNYGAGGGGGGAFSDGAANKMRGKGGKGGRGFVAIYY